MRQQTGDGRARRPLELGSGASAGYTERLGPAASEDSRSRRTMAGRAKLEHASASRPAHQAPRLGARRVRGSSASSSRSRARSRRRRPSRAHDVGARDRDARDASARSRRSGSTRATSSSFGSGRSACRSANIRVEASDGGTPFLTARRATAQAEDLRAPRRQARHRSDRDRAAERARRPEGRQAPEPRRSSCPRQPEEGRARRSRRSPSSRRARPRSTSRSTTIRVDRPRDRRRRHDRRRRRGRHRLRGRGARRRGARSHGRCASRAEEGRAPTDRDRRGHALPARRSRAHRAEADPRAPLSTLTARPTRSGRGDARSAATSRRPTSATSSSSLGHFAVDVPEDEGRDPEPRRPREGARADPARRAASRRARRSSRAGSRVDVELRYTPRDADPRPHGPDRGPRHPRRSLQLREERSRASSPFGAASSRARSRRSTSPSSIAEIRDVEVRPLEKGIPIKVGEHRHQERELHARCCATSTCTRRPHVTWDIRDVHVADVQGHGRAAQHRRRPDRQDVRLRRLRPAGAGPAHARA